MEQPASSSSLPNEAAVGTDDPYWWIVNESARDLYTTHIMPAARPVRKRVGVLRVSLNHAWGSAVRKRHGASAQFLEFGVHEAKDLIRMSSFLVQNCAQETASTSFTFHGFDSFEGLPTDWDNGQLLEDKSLAFTAGKFDLGGVTPELALTQSKLNGKLNQEASRNIVLHQGWFSDTVPAFFDTHTGPIAFVHADADLYGSTLEFLDEMCKRNLLVPGSVIVFDEYTNYTNWQDGEHKAWSEICLQFKIEFEYLCYHAPTAKDSKTPTYGYQSVSVVITTVG